MLEQTLKRYVTLPGVMDQLEQEMKDAIKAIKARMFEACVEQMYRSSKGEQRVWLGRIKDAIAELGACTAYEVCRGAAYPEQYAASIFGDVQKVDQSLQRHRDLFMTREDDEKVRKG